jgi:hypothetical protein
VTEERALAPASSGLSPISNSSRSIHRSKFIPTWLAHAVVSIETRRIDGVVLARAVTSLR